MLKWSRFHVAPFKGQHKRGRNSCCIAWGWHYSLLWSWSRSVSHPLTLEEIWSSATEWWTLHSTFCNCNVAWATLFLRGKKRTRVANIPVWQGGRCYRKPRSWGSPAVSTRLSCLQTTARIDRVQPYYHSDKNSKLLLL